MLCVRKITELAQIPVRCLNSVGYDLSSAYDYVIPAWSRMLCKTDLIIMVPEGTYGRIAPRSGLAVKYCLDVGAGVIDPNFRGNVCILLCNGSDKDYTVQKGDRIAQLILEVIITPDVCEFEDVHMADVTERGAAGFGSTGD